MNLDEFITKMKRFEKDYGVPVDFELVNEIPTDKVFISPLDVRVEFK